MKHFGKFWFLLVSISSLTKSEFLPGNEKNLTFTLSASNLPAKDSGSKNDAYVKVYLKSGEGEDAHVGTTDVVKGSDKPFWPTVLSISWRKGTNQELHFIVRDSSVGSTGKHIGEVRVNVDDFAENNQDLRLSLLGGGHLRILGTQPFRFKLFARNVPKLDNFGGKSDPYVEIYWRQENNVDYFIASTSEVDDSETPDWEDIFEFAAYRPGTQQVLYFKLYDYDPLSKDDLIGSVLLDADLFVSKKTTKIADISNEKGQPVTVDDHRRATLAIVPL